MAQAKTLSEKELKIVLGTVAQRRHAARNRAMILLSHLSGMRVGEIAALRIGDVVANDGTINEQINLRADQTKGDKGRVVMISERLRKELSTYVATLKYRDVERPFFYTQRTRSGFSANSLCQQFGMFYREAGLNGATSHSGRRTFITTLANRGIGVRVLMALAGHKNMSTTQRYIDLNDEMMKVAVNLL